MLTAALGCAASTPPIVSGARPRLTQTRHQQRQPRQPLLADLKSHPPVPTMGIVLTAFQIINNVAGAGILTLAAGMAAGVGWYPAILTTLALGAVSGYSFFLIGAFEGRHREMAASGRLVVSSSQSFKRSSFSGNEWLRTLLGKYSRFSSALVDSQPLIS